MSKEAMKLALEALESCGAAHITDGGRQWYDEKLVDTAYAALQEALAKPDFWEGYVPEPDKRQQALDKKAENARELGLDYEPAQQEPVAWTPIDQPYPPGGELDILMGDGSILCEVLPQADGDLWWGGASTGERFIDPKYASVTHWRIHAEHTSPPAQQEPVAWYDSKTGWTDFHPFKPARKPSAPDAEWLPLYTSPPAQRTWVGLTDDEIAKEFYKFEAAGAWYQFARAIEAKLKEKNT